MKKGVFQLLFPFILCCCSGLKAQEASHVRMGFQLQQIGVSFGLGTQVEIPLSVHGTRLRLSAGHHWLEGEDPDQTYGFQTLRLGLGSQGWQITEGIKVYGEGGVFFVLASNELSSRRLAPGGFGLFGFEFYTSEASGSSVFLEFAGNGAGSRLDRRDSIPPFGSGLLVQVGMRFNVF